MIQYNRVAVESCCGKRGETVPTSGGRGLDVPGQRRRRWAFAGLYDRHSRAPYSLAYRMMGGRQAAEDLVQEAFSGVWRVPHSYRTQRGSVHAWILSFVRNRSIDQLRAMGSRRRVQDRVEATASVAQPSEAFAETRRNAHCEQIRAALRGLAARTAKRAGSLAYYSGYTHTEIAEQLDLPIGTVRGRMRLGLQKIRKCFDASGREVPRWATNDRDTTPDVNPA